MKYIRPEYYDTFRCLAGQCPDSCCQDWEVEVDALSAQRYLTLDGELGCRLRQYLVQQEDTFYLKITDGRCPMWRKDGLCQIQAQLGEEGLCQVCGQFPRLTHDYGSFVEQGLELSCPEAARLILNAQPMALPESYPLNDEAQYDVQAMGVLLRTRRQALTLLEQGDVTQALCLLLLYGYRAQEELDGGESLPWDSEAELTFARSLATQRAPEKLIELYSQLEILTQRWQDRLQSAEPAQHWAEELRAMARYGVQRHWLQAVSDYDLIGRVKLIVSGCILVHELGGDVVATAQLWSKEIENSTENMEALMDSAYTSPLMTDAVLLGLLQKDHCQSNAC